MSRRGKKKTLWKPYSCLSFVKYFFLRYSKTKVCRTNWCREILYVLCNKQGFIKYQLLCWGSWPSMWTSDRITQVTEGCFRFQTEGKYGWARSITVQVWAVYACNKKFWFLYFFLQVICSIVLKIISKQQMISFIFILLIPMYCEEIIIRILPFKRMWEN